MKRYSELSEEERKEHHKKYYQRNKEKMREYSRNYYPRNKEKRKEYCERNKERISEYNKKYYQENKEKYKPNTKEYGKEWRRKCKEEWIKLLGGKCMHCGNDNKVVLDFHHIDLSKKEGSPDRRNKKEFRKAIEEKEIILLCANCHRQEHHNIKMKKGRDANE